MIQKRATTDDKTIMKTSRGETFKAKRTAPSRRRSRKAPLDYHIVVDDRVLQEAKIKARENEKFVPVDETTMRSVYVDPDKGGVI